MGAHTTIEYCDTTVSSVMGCDGWVVLKVPDEFGSTTSAVGQTGSL